MSELPAAATGPADAPQPSPGRLLRRELPWLLVALLAAWPPLLWLLSSANPELAVRLSLLLRTGLQQLAFWLTMALLLALALLPVARAGLRLGYHRLVRQLGNDRGPLLQALADLQHYASPARHLEVGRLALQRGEFELAGPHLAAALQQEPRNPAAQHQFGLFCLRLGECKPARHSFLAAEQLEPGHQFGDALLFAGRAAMLLGDYDEAARLLQQHQQQHGGNRRSRYWLGSALLRHGDRQAAAAAFRSAAKDALGPLTAEENWYRALAQLAAWRLS